MAASAAHDDIAAPRSFGEMTAVFARIGVLSFGGPAGQIALMHRVLVDEKRWVSEERFLHALNYCMLLPGPEAQQLATYIGWLLHGIRGGIVAGLLFVLPGLAVIIGLSTAYAIYQDATWLTGLFFGLKAAVLAVVVEAVIRLGRKTLNNRFMVTISALTFSALFFFSLPFPLVVLLAGSAGFAAARLKRQPSKSGGQDTARLRPPGLGSLATLLFWSAVWQLPLALLWLAPGTETLAAMFAFFSKMALVTFGGAYAVLAYVAQVAVQDYGWLKPGEMLDGLALAETTPGPLVLVLSFVGYLSAFRDAMGVGQVAAGVLGALLVAWATFVPSFIWIFAGAPYIEGLRGRTSFSGALSAITAAVVGVILNLSVWFGLHVLFRQVQHVEIWPAVGLRISWPAWGSLDPAAFMLFLFSSWLLLWMKVGMVTVLFTSAAAGLTLKALGFL